MSNGKGAAIVFLALAGVVLCSCKPGAGLSGGAGDDWTSHNGGYEEGAFSRLAEIDRENVAKLGLAWSLDLPGEATLEATPLAVDGKLYFTGSTSTVYAVDAATGKQLWRYDPEIYRYLPENQRLIFPVNRGAAWWNGKLYVGTIDGRLIALDAATGKPVWSVPTIKAGTKQTITGAPRAYNGKVVIGNGGADWGARGYVTAYDAQTGARLWRFYTVPGGPTDEVGDAAAMQIAAKTWAPEHWKVSGGGGTVWDSMTYDPELNPLYIGVGNSGPYDPRVRSPGNGDNLFLTSIVALDADTGKYIWHYQTNPREAWDYKATANMVATTIDIDGEPRKVLMQAPTNGFFYVLDRNDGKLLSAEKITKVSWASHIDLKTGRPVEMPNIRYESGSGEMWPSPFGAHNWQTMSYSPVTGLVYIPTMKMGARFELQPAQQQAGGKKQFGLGGVLISPLLKDPDDGTGALLAWDPKTQKARWKVPHAAFWNGGTMVTAGGLVFQGDGDGNFSAYDAENGARLWTFDAGLGIVGAPIAYRAAGKDYVSILVGYGGATAAWSTVIHRGWKFGLQPRRLLTFALDGKAKLPPTPPPDMTVDALDDPALAIDPTRVASGAVLYGTKVCVMCHGANLLSAGAPGPDLRESRIALDRQAFADMLREGSLAPNGMPRYAELSDEEVLDLYMFIRSGARDAIEKPSAKPAAATAAGRL
jgi:quinohemoprotein ethanol dehydrogenase